MFGENDRFARWRAPEPRDIAWHNGRVAATLSGMQRLIISIAIVLTPLGSPRDARGQVIDLGLSSDTPSGGLVIERGSAESTEPIGASTDVAPSAGTTKWPMEDSLHPAATAVPTEYQSDYREAAKWFKRNVRDEKERVKAMHDWVTLKLTYDWPALTGKRPSQEPDDVVATGRAVCEGYARLLAAMAGISGDDIRYVVGDIRKMGRDGQTTGRHAWNVAKIGGEWFLLDPTWNDESLSRENSEDKRPYRTDYLFAPPEVFGWTHRPDSSRWQLRGTALSHSKFMAQPLLHPKFKANRLGLVSPRGIWLEVEKRKGKIELRNPDDVKVVGLVRDKSGRVVERCEVAGGAKTEVFCFFPDAGEYQVDLHASSGWSWAYIGQFMARAR